jgi:hypothetical protein
VVEVVQGGWVVLEEVGLPGRAVAGGPGGLAGDAGGGGGGPSIGIIEDGSSTSNLSAGEFGNNRVTLGTSARGGAHANPVLSDDATGERAAYKKL